MVVAVALFWAGEWAHGLLISWSGIGDGVSRGHKKFFSFQSTVHLCLQML